MSPKQEIYRALLSRTLPYLRVMAGISLWRRLLNPRLWKDQATYEEAQLVHNLHPSLFEPEFVDHDLWFLNWQAKYYCEHAQCSPYYQRHVELIRELFALVPEPMRSQLRWPGPEVQAKEG